MRKTLILIALLILSNNIFSQEISENERLLYCWLNTQNAKSSDYIDSYFTRVTPTISGSANIPILDLYMKTYFNAEWKRKLNDEFEFSPFKKKCAEKLDYNIQNADLNYIFTYNSTATLGDYNFEYKGFPIWDFANKSHKLRLLNDSKIDELNLFFANANEYKNVFDFSMVKIDEVTAKQFINGRKDANGNINRKINCIVYYKVFRPKEGGCQLYITNFVLSDPVINAKIAPQKSFEEYLKSLNNVSNVNITKTDTIYLNQRFSNATKGSSSAIYYTVVKYQGTKKIYPQLTYFLDGALAVSESRELGGGLLHGERKRFYKNGNLESLRNYDYGKEVGQSTEYYENGKIKAQITFSAGWPVNKIYYDENGNKIP